MDSSWAKPAGQSRQVPFCVYVPGGQSPHVAMPGLLVDLPCGHRRQAAWAVVSVMKLIGHGRHWMLPVEFWCSPGTHGRHEAEALAGW